MKPKRYPLPKRFNLALSDKAYENLRDLNKRYGYGNNYLLTIILESVDRVLDPSELDLIFREFENEYGAPKLASMKKDSDIK